MSLFPAQAERNGTFMTVSAPLALYLHWPFCRSKCPYCAFNSHVREQVDQTRWRAALLRELETARALTGPRPLESLFFGGGTPSLMPPETVAALIDRALTLWPPAAAPEITLEANPDSAEAGRFRDFAAAGVNRLSLGVQALNDRDLRSLGRRHSAAAARQALEIAAACFPRYSFDLIYGRPRQTAPAWRAELRQALALAGDHLSLYELTVEPETPFHDRLRQGRLVLPPEGAAAALYAITGEETARHGLPAYEVCNHARPGGESRHNLVYWRYGDYLGIGPGAHGRLTVDGEKRARLNIRTPEDWLQAVESHGHGLAEETPVSPARRMREALLMGLRLCEGVPLDRLAREAGLEASRPPLDPLRLAQLQDGGFLTVTEDRLTATPAGRRRLNAVLAFLAD